MTLVKRHGTHGPSELTRLRAENGRLRAALVAVDSLWGDDARLGFEKEMAFGTPVGNVWKQVRDALN